MDASSIIPSKAYFLRGSTLADLLKRQDALWGGDNIQRGPGIRLRGSGKGGLTIASNPAVTQRPSGSGASAHAYTVSDASLGATPKIGVTPGSHNGVVPTINGSPMNVKIGSPLAYPVLTLGGSDTLVYFQIDYDTGGNILTIEIKSGGTLPTATIVSGTAGSDYKLLSTVAITYATGSGNASVQCNNDAVSGPQSYSQCGSVSYSTLS